MTVSQHDSLWVVGFHAFGQALDPEASLSNFVYDVISVGISSILLMAITGN
jgi:hypothetical protein